MPQYSFKNPETEEVIDVFFHMNDEKVFIDEDGLEWSRVFTVPQAAIDVNLDPFSERQFLDKTAKGGTLGDLWDRSAEASEKREKITGGEDSLKRKTFNEYSEKRKGKKHEHDRKKK